MRGLVPKKPKHRRLRGDWSLKNLNNMADSSEKVSFRVDMQCSSLRAEAFLVFDRGSQPTLGQQITNMLPTVVRQSADCWQKIFVKGGKRQSADCRPTVGRLLVNSRPTVRQLSADSRPTVFWGSCSSLFPKGAFHSVRESDIWFVLRIIKRNYKLKFFRINC